MLDVVMKTRIPLYMHRKSSHIHTVWRHVILPAFRQHEGKGHRRFVEWLREACHPGMFMQPGKVPHYTTLQKFASGINGTLMYRMASSFMLPTKIRKLFVGMDASGFRSGNASSCYTDRTGIRKKYIKPSMGAELKEQVACSLKTRRAPKHDTMDFRPIMERASGMMPLYSCSRQGL